MGYWKKGKLIAVGLHLFFFMGSPAIADEVVIDDFPEEALRITESSEVIKVEPENFDPLTANFEKVDGTEIKIDYSKKPTWIKVVLKNSSGDPIDGVISLGSPLTGHLDLYENRGGKLVHLYKSGSSVRWYDRIIPGTAAGFPIILDGQERKELYFKRLSHHRLDTGIFLGTLGNFNQSEDKKFQLMLVYAGAIFALFIYNLFLYLYSRELVYFLYCWFTASVSFTVLNIQGILDYFFANLSFTASDYLLCFSAMSITAGPAFTRQFIEIKKYAPKLGKVFTGIFIAGATHIIIYLSPLYPFFGSNLGITIDITILLGCILMLGSGVWCVKKGSPMARFYMASWAFMFAGVFAWFGMYYGIFPKNAITNYSLLWGNLAEMLVVALGLAFKLNVLNQEKREALLRAMGKERYQRLVRVLLHDMGTPMSVINSYTSMWERDPEKFREKIDQAMTKTSRAAQNIIDVLERIREQEIQDDAKGVFKLKPINLVRVLEESKMLFEDSLGKKKVKLDMQIHDDECEILAEKSILLNEIINNVISNAIKFSPEGGVITLKTKCLGEKVSLEIEDQGGGIPKDLVASFYQGGSIPSTPGTNGEKGSGFGLPLVRDYMETLDGKLDIHSPLGNGGGTSIMLNFKKAV